MRINTLLLVMPACLLGQAQDANYRALRDGKLAESYNTENIVLQRDAGTLTFKSGELSFLAPVLGRRAVAVFTGQGRFHLKPALPTETARLWFTIGAPEIDEEFDAALLYFTDATAEEVRGQAKAGPVSAKNEAELEKFRSQLRTRVENPRSFMEYEMFGADIPNLDAELLAELYNAAHAGSFVALLHAHKHPQMRFLIRPQGAIPSMGPEEVALIDIDPGGTQDGIWYMAHTVEEIHAHRYSSSEDKRVIATEHYEMDVHVGRNDHLSGKTTLRFRAMRDGDRVIPFSLLPSLRVSAASLDGKPTDFIQEGAKQDGELSLILPQATMKGHEYTAEMEYAGNKVIQNEGKGNYSVGARENWYPAVSVFRDRATYDITFHAPRGLTLVGVGKLVGEKREGGDTVTEWKSDEPLLVAGFNYGDFKKKERIDDVTKTTLDAYATTEPPDVMAFAARNIVLAPSAMADRVLVDALNAVRLYTHWYGPDAYGRLAVTQQPAFDFGQSWPTLVYLPISAFLDPTMRWELLGQNTFRFSKEFVNVVTAHEVAHQWWGHMVGWPSYHDNWLSEGFADFSAGLFLEFTQPNGDDAQKFWESERRMLLEKNQYGNRANDVGPLWMGERLNSFRASDASRRIIYAKGAFVLHMLRYLMQDRKTGDLPFIEMMHDYLTTYNGKSASTQDFQRMAEKHMRPEMDLEHNGHLDWFFQEWVYGTEVPSYRLEYTLADAEGGKTLLTMKITQEGVDPLFKMRVPVYVDYDGRPSKLGTVPMLGSSTSNELKVTLAKRPRRVLLNANDDILAAQVVQK
ncbi:MAG: M1 family aminopeptidase [Bryobacteraceae bacterium]